MSEKADFHIHSDYHEPVNRWYGLRPNEIAGGVIHENLGAFAVTEHHKTSQRVFDVQAEIAEFFDKEKETTPKPALEIMGAELTIYEKKHKLHVGYLFKEDFNRHNFPKIEMKKGSLAELEQLQRDYPGVAILNHPGSNDGDTLNNQKLMLDVLNSRLFQGIEVFNGALLGISADRATAQAIWLYLQAKKSGQTIAPIGSSDCAARRSHVGHGYTLLQAKTKAEVFTAIESGQTQAIYPDKYLRERLSYILKEEIDDEGLRFEK